MTLPNTYTKSAIKKEVCINGMTIKVMKKTSSSSQLLAEGIITSNDYEMDQRARTAINMEIQKAKVCKKPIAMYDNKNKEAYLVYADKR